MNPIKRFLFPCILIASAVAMAFLLTPQMGCKKEEPKPTSLPFVGDFWYKMQDGAHDDPLKVTDTSITVDVEILDDGGLTVTGRGICWGTTVNPSITGNRTSEGTGTGKFSSHINGLSPTGYYFIRAYATNSLGTAYGPCLPVHTFSGTMKDADSNSYYTILIGTREWMGENLRSTKLNDGTPILFEPNTTMWPVRTIPEYCHYQDVPMYGDVYGKLYNGYAVLSGKLCPTGWHVPTYDDWRGLFAVLGDSLTAGAKMKRPGTHVWDGDDKDASNESGFTALPGGLFTLNGGCGGESGFTGHLTGSGWWSATSGPGDSVLYVPYILASSSSYFQDFRSLEEGLSVRCIKD
jgi:uncharacterized protein (TIGR02145 family)